MGYAEFRDANGVGQQVKASSIPVVIASDQALSVSVSDGSGPLTVDGTVAVSGTVPTSSTQLPSALGQQTLAGSLSVVPGRTATDNTTYVVNGDMSADVTGAAISVGPLGILLAHLIWAATGTAIGTISLQGLMPDGATWLDIPGASAEFLSQPNNNAGAIMTLHRGLEAFTSVRFKYTRTSGGTANTSLNIDTRVL